MKNYLELDGKTGTFYHYSGSEAPGYEAYTSATGNTSYRKYFKKGIYGSLKTAYIKSEDRGVQVRIIMENGTEWYMLKFPIKSSQGRLDSYMESLAAFLPNLELGTEYRIFPYVMDVKTPAGKEVTRRGVSIVEAELDGAGDGTAGAKIQKALRYLTKDEVYTEAVAKDGTVVPKLDFKAGLGGKFMPTASSIAIKTEFFEDLIQREVARLDVQPEQDETNEAPAVKQAPAAEAEVAAKPDKFKDAKVGVEIEVDEDDLPF